MTEEEKLIHEFVLENIWTGIEQTRQAVDTLDSKANNMITISGALMTIIGGVLISSDKTNLWNSFFLLLILLPLIGCVYYAFETIKIKKQEILDVEKAYSFLYYEDYFQALGDMSVSVGEWQKRLKKDVLNPKSSSLKLCMECFKSTLVLISILSFFKIILLLYSS